MRLFAEKIYRDLGMWMRLVAAVAFPMTGLAQDSSNEPQFDPLFFNTASKDASLVLQANFGATNPKTAPTDATGTPTTPPLRQEFRARLFGSAPANGKVTLQFNQPTVNGVAVTDIELRLTGKTDPEQTWPVSVSFTANHAGFWSWEGTFSVPENEKNNPVQLGIQLGKQTPIAATLGTVWVMAGAPNLNATSSLGGPPVGVQMRAFPGGASYTVVEKPKGVPDVIFSGAILPAQFALRLAMGLQRPVAVYVVSQPRTVLSDWQLQKKNFLLDNPLWNSLRGSAGMGPAPLNGKADPVTIGARGLVWWHGEWQAEQFPQFDGSTSASNFADFQDKYRAGLVSGKTSPAGVLVDAATLLTTGSNEDGTARADDVAATIFSRIVVQMGGSSQAAKTSARFPFGRDLAKENLGQNLDPSVVAGWLRYQMPDSTWARLRVAQAKAVQALRDTSSGANLLEAVLVPSLPVEDEKDIPMTRVWTQKNANGYAELADRLANAAVFSMTHGENSADGQMAQDFPDLPSSVQGLGTTTVTVTLPTPMDGKLAGGGAIMEVHHRNDPLDRWSSVPIPDLAKQVLVFTSPTPLDGIRYAWGDGPGKLLTYDPSPPPPPAAKSAAVVKPLGTPAPSTPKPAPSASTPAPSGATLVPAATAPAHSSATLATPGATSAPAAPAPVSTPRPSILPPFFEYQPKP